jgi:enoyl-[acyl-carrier protein] reductase I
MSSSLLAGKTILITGMISNRSIAFGVARACAREGARLVFSYAGEGLRERTEKLVAELGGAPYFPCDVTRDEDLAALATWLKGEVGHLDGFLHAIAFAPREAIAGDFLDGLSRESFRVAHDVSSYSLAAMAKALYPLMEGRSASILTLTYLGGVRVVPNYNTMGLAKASLDMNVRYLASSLGPKGIRVNGISAGPIKTPAAAGIGGFGKILKFVEQHAPLRRNVTIEDVGNAAAFYLSDYAAGITGEVTYVDGGFNVVTPGMAEA